MLILRIALLLHFVATVLTVHSVHFRDKNERDLRNYELRRPLQYFFHLLELKSKFNPMLGGVTGMGDHCSSKAGPFCKITGHEPFQSYQLRYNMMNENSKLIYNSLVAQQKQTIDSYQKIARMEQEVFLIRNDMINAYD